MSTDVNQAAAKRITFYELDLSMSPMKALAQVGTFIPFDDALVKNLLRITAKDIYKHEKNISFFAKRVSPPYSKLKRELTRTVS